MSQSGPSPARMTSDLHLGGIPFGRYLLLSRLNMGGMAEVHLAKTLGLHGFERFVAIKRILPGVADDPEFVRMFIDEAKLSVQLTHANIAQTFELGRIGKSLFIAMEYVSGIDLRMVWEHAQTGAPLPIGAIVYMVAKLCEGLDYAHRKTDAEGRALGIVHRDISPQNVMVAYDGQVKIIDFGIAKAKVRASRTRVGILKGKFAYMSPEQVAGGDLDGRSDVFSVGIILYELLTRTRLFKSESDFATLERVRNVELFPPRLVNPAVPRELEAIVLRALRRDRDERAPSAEALHQMLMRFALQTGETFNARELESYLAQEFADPLKTERDRLQALTELKPPPNLVLEEATPGKIDAVDETFAAMTGVFTKDIVTTIRQVDEVAGATADADRTRYAPPPPGIRPPLEATRMLQELSGAQTPNLRRTLERRDDTRLAERRPDRASLRRFPMHDDPSRSSARLRHPRFGREAVVLWSATVFAAACILFAFWLSGRLNPNARLRLEAEPPTARFTVNGRSTGETHSLIDFEVAPGLVVVEVRAPAHCAKSLRLNLTAGESYSTQVRLENEGQAGCP